MFYFLYISFIKMLYLLLFMVVMEIRLQNNTLIPSEHVKHIFPKARLDSAKPRGGKPCFREDGEQ